MRALTAAGFAVVAGLVITAGCSDAFGPEDAFGTWDLELLNGEQLPTAVTIFGDETFTLVSLTLMLDEGGDPTVPGGGGCTFEVTSIEAGKETVTDCEWSVTETVSVFLGELALAGEGSGNRMTLSDAWQNVWVFRRR